MQTPVDIQRFRAFLQQRGHAHAWPDSQLWLALQLVERFRGAGIFYGNQHTGSLGLGNAKLAPNGGGDGTSKPGPKNGKTNGLKPVTKKEARRDFSKNKGDSQQDFHVHVGDKVRELLHGLGFPVKEPLPALETSSVYLKGKKFDVRISDGHDAKPKKQSTPRAKPEYQLTIPPGSSRVSATKVNKLLSDIAANHGKAKP